MNCYLAFAYRAPGSELAILYPKLLPYVNALTRFACMIFTAVRRLHILFIEVIIQFSTAMSVFFLAVPTPVNFTQFITVDLVSSTGVENLKAIQQELYISSPLLMLLSVISLLVALIGVATIKK